MAKLECIVIGEQSISLECLKILKKRGYRILGVYSSNPYIINWVKENRILLFESIEKCYDFIREHSVSLLFSVVNAFIIPAEILAHIRLQAINFHNGPLPRYAGVNGPAHAILNNEKTYGVTWHLMTEKIDTGTIVKQRLFNINKKETAFSLELKCIKFGIKAFVDLLHDIEASCVELLPQSLQERTYYTYSDKLPEFGIINWRSNAESIYRSYRASYAGGLENHFCTLKFCIDGILYLPTKINVLEKTKFNPGQIAAINVNFLTVACADCLIQLQAPFYTIDGDPIEVRAIVSKHSLRKQTILPLPPNNLFNFKEEFKQKNFEKEAFFILKRMNPICCFSGYRKIVQVEKIKTIKLDFLAQEQIDIQKLSRQLALEPQELCLFIILTIFYFFNDLTSYFIELRLAENTIESLFSESLPFQFVADELDALSLVIERFKKSLRVSKKHPIIERDVYLRSGCITKIKTNLLFISLIGKKCYPEKINFLIEQIQGKLSISIKFSEGLITPDEEKLLKTIPERFISLSRIFLNSTKLNMSQISILTPREIKNIKKNMMVKEDYPLLDIVTGFENSVRRVPNKIALQDNNRQLTYHTLDLISTLFANDILSIVGETKQQVPIGIILSDKLEVIVSQLAILKAGHYYVPLDVNYPISYLQEFLVKFNIHHLITTSSVYKKLLSIFESKPEQLFLIQAKEITDNLKLTEEASQKFILRKRNPTDIAYMILTSGTTGVPKGVLIADISIIRLVLSRNFSLQINHKDIVAQTADPSFDAATYEIWGALLNRATLEVFSKDEIVDLRKFSTRLESAKVSVLWLTTALFNTCIVYRASVFGKIRKLLVGGEKLDPACMQKLFSEDNRPKYVINGYGPTENTTFSTTWIINKREVEHGNIPIGRPISGTNVVLLNRLDQPVSAFTPGRIYVGGAGLLVKYYGKNRDEVLKSVKVFDSINQLYHTGDRGYYDERGVIHYLDREDNQVKIRGYRLDLSYIEEIVNQSKLVDLCSAIKVKDGNFDKLILFCCKKKSNKSVAAIKKEVFSYLEKKIPMFYLPSDIIILNSIPINKNGKVNKEDLKDFLEKKRRLSGEEQQGTDAETTVKNIWKKILNVSKISIDDNFFRMGGDSLLLISMLSLLSKQVRFNFSVENFLLEPTIRGLLKTLPGQTSLASYQKILQEDVLLNLDGPKDSLKKKTKENNQLGILITGATGFIGVHFLVDIYTKSTAKLYCLVHCKEEEEAWKKFHEALAAYHLSLIPPNNRIEIICGDLEKPHFGLENDLYTKLVDDVDQIFHIGAHVHHIYSYDILRAANTLSTKEILKLATTGNAKKIHYVSTLTAAYELRDEQGFIQEKFIVQKEPPLSISDGYTVSKWASESLIGQAVSENYISANIYRLGWVVGTTQACLMPKDKNHLYLLIKLCIDLGIAPEWDFNISIVPVNFITGLLVRNALEPNYMEKSEVYNVHIAQNITWQELITRLRELGHSIKFVGMDQWFKIAVEKSSESSGGVLLPIYFNEQLTNRWKYDQINNVTCVNFYQYLFEQKFLSNSVLLDVNLLLKNLFRKYYEQE